MCLHTLLYFARYRKLSHRTLSKKTRFLLETQPITHSGCARDISAKEGNVRRVVVVLTTLVALLLLQGKVLAWNGTGHTVVAYIAWKNLTPDTKKAVFAI